MKSRHQRLSLVLLVVAVLALATYLVLNAFKENLVFFFTPSQIQAGQAPTGRSFRVGGLVEKGSLRRGSDGLTSTFVVTDLAHRVTVQYRGLLPDLFKEGKGVVAQGQLQANQIFIAQEVLAKHDENYMPPQVTLQKAAASKEVDSMPYRDATLAQGAKP